ncbi:unnamed protein product [Periconia digitata]|uniref:RING-type domain-containing protein n=1 Tax=Periconia digitata TaxID=1303443 RepID=A0A9W4UAP1_9PLEO|nr:unnamed protein product [Periconia digitata]
MKSKFPTLLDILESNIRSRRRTDRVLAVVSAIATSMVCYSVNPAFSRRRWLREIKPCYLPWLQDQSNRGRIDTLGRQARFLDEIYVYVQKKVGANIPNSLLRTRNSLPRSLVFPGQVFEKTCGICQVIDDELFAAAKHYLTTSRAYEAEDLHELKRKFRFTVKGYRSSYKSRPFSFWLRDPHSSTYPFTLAADDEDFSSDEESSDEESSDEESADEESSDDNVSETEESDYDHQSEGNGIFEREYSPVPSNSQKRSILISEDLYMEVLPNFQLPPEYVGIGEECPICHEEYGLFEPSQGKMSRAKCGNYHVFHRACLSEWVNDSHSNTCPVCRGVLFTESNQISENRLQTGARVIEGIDTLTPVNKG